MALRTGILLSFPGWEEKMLVEGLACYLGGVLPRAR